MQRRVYKSLSFTPRSRNCPQQLVRSTHVNLVDFIDTRITGKPIEIFETVKELRNYTRKNKKYYPKESAKESGVLKYLLRKILSYDPNEG